MNNGADVSGGAGDGPSTSSSSSSADSNPSPELLLKMMSILSQANRINNNTAVGSVPQSTPSSDTDVSMECVGSMSRRMSPSGTAAHTAPHTPFNMGRNMGEAADANDIHMGGGVSKSVSNTRPNSRQTTPVPTGVSSPLPMDIQQSGTNDEAGSSSQRKQPVSNAALPPTSHDAGGPRSSQSQAAAAGSNESSSGDAGPSSNPSPSGDLIANLMSLFSRSTTSKPARSTAATNLNSAASASPLSASSRGLQTANMSSEKKSSESAVMQGRDLLPFAQQPRQQQQQQQSAPQQQQQLPHMSTTHQTNQPHKLPTAPPVSHTMPQSMPQTAAQAPANSQAGFENSALGGFQHTPPVIPGLSSGQSVSQHNSQQPPLLPQPQPPLHPPHSYSMQPHMNHSQRQQPPNWDTVGPPPPKRANHAAGFAPRCPPLVTHSPSQTPAPPPPSLAAHGKRTKCVGIYLTDTDLGAGLYELQEDDVFRLLRNFGGVKKVRVHHDGPAAEVEFETEEAARDALTHLGHVDIPTMGRLLAVPVERVADVPPGPPASEVKTPLVPAAADPQVVLPPAEVIKQLTTLLAPKATDGVASTSGTASAEVLSSLAIPGVENIAQLTPSLNRICRLEIVDIFGHEPRFDVTQHILGHNNSNILYILTTASHAVDIGLKGLPVNEAPVIDRLHMAITSHNVEAYNIAVEMSEDLLASVCQLFIDFCIENSYPLPITAGFKRHEYREQPDKSVKYIGVKERRSSWFEKVAPDYMTILNPHDQTAPAPFRERRPLVFPEENEHRDNREHRAASSGGGGGGRSRERTRSPSWSPPAVRRESGGSGTRDRHQTSLSGGRTRTGTGGWGSRGSSTDTRNSGH